MNENNDHDLIKTVALLASYVPRRCGIATFTNDLRNAIAGTLSPEHVSVIAMDDDPDAYRYPDEVRFQIPTHERSEYLTAANLLNIYQTDIALIQHEYGIFGGKDGSYILDFMRRLRMPILTTLHTVLTEPSPGQRSVLNHLAQSSDRLIVMSHLAQSILQDVYDVPDRKIAYIPHGIPDVPFTDSSFFKDQFNLQGRTVLLTFGLLTPGKGIEVAIRAMPRIIEKHPDAMYVVLGATHPNIYRTQGNAYRHSLEKLVDELHLNDHVTFHNRFVTQKELLSYLSADDIYISPYPNKAQITSGTLAYALGAGKAVVSTPFWHAEEMLAEDRGRLFEFNNSDLLADQVNDLLDNPVELHAMRKRAYMHCREMIWANTAQQYIDLANAVHAERRKNPIAVHPVRSSPPSLSPLPDLNLAHLRRLTDATGIYQHAVYAVPDRNHGYCTDDNARALVAVLLHYDLHQDSSLLRFADTYLSFLHHAFNPELNRFRNFLSFDRRWLEEDGSDDVQGRVFWALGLTVSLAPNDAMLTFATRLFNDALGSLPELPSPRSWAFALVGLHAYLQRFSGDTRARRVRHILADKLHDAFKANASDDWPWPEDIVTYDNAKIPHALILAGQWIPDPDMLETGLRSLQWLVDLQFTDSHTVSLIGNHGWLTRDGQRARFDQQPIEAMALIEACAEAFRSTQDQTYIHHARRCLGWFTGSNDIRASLYDFQTGGCRDGLHADGTNLNQGAESTLAWLISLLTVLDLNRAQASLDLQSATQIQSASPSTTAAP